MTFGSVCSGIEAASVAWKPLGWRAAWYSEIDAFASAVLACRHGETPNLGDMQRITEREEFRRESIGLLVGGTPCQSFSVAGLRRGLDDPRGNLALVFLQIAERARPAWLVWENVPGVLSSGEGRDFGSFLGGLEELGYGWAYRTLDAQYFGLAQRRRRVFVVGYLGDWRPASAVLFERESLSGNPPPGREAGQDVAGSIAGGSEPRGWRGDLDTQGAYIPLTGDQSRCLTSRNARNARNDGETDTFIAHCLTSTAHDWSRAENYPLALAENQRGEIRTMDVASALGGLGGKVGQGYQAVQEKSRVRRLTPREWERLMGFPDDYTLIPYRGRMASDGPRYQAIGNSMAVPVMRWIGERIQKLEEISP